MAAAFEAGLKSPIAVPVTQVAYWNRRRVAPDADNILSSLKAAWDGVTDSGVWEDDRLTVHLPVCRRADKLNPRVEIRIFDGLPPNLEDLITQTMREDCRWQATTKPSSSET